jgi:hypothetical protein
MLIGGEKSKYATFRQHALHHPFAREMYPQNPFFLGELVPLTVSLLGELILRDVNYVVPYILALATLKIIAHFSRIKQMS